MGQLTPDEKRQLLKRLLAERAAAASASHALAHGQRALWFLQRLVPETFAYNVAFAARLEPGLDLDAFRRALDQLVVRHAALRTTFPEQDGQPVQRVLAPGAAPLRVVEMGDASEDDVHAAVCADYRRPFDLEASLFAAVVYRRPREDVLLLVVHHLVFDAWSLQVLFEDLRLLYDDELAGVRAELPPPAAQYADFVQAQTQLLGSARGEALWAYWAEALGGTLPSLEIASAAPRPPVLTLRGGSVPFAIDAERSAALHALARAQHATLYTVVVAATQLLLHRFSGQRDVIVGTPVSLRTRSEFARVVGYFINMLPIRAAIDPDESFTAFLARTRERVLGALDHQDFPFPVMVDRLQVRREPNRNPIFQAMLNIHVSPRTTELARLFDHAQQDAMRLGASRLTPYAFPQQEGQFELVIELMDAEGGLHGNLKYQSELYTPDAARHLRDAFVALLGAIVRDPGARVADLVAAPREDFEL